MSEQSKRDTIDLGKVFRVLWSKKKVFFIMWPIVAVLSVLWILPEPRYYKCSVSLAPEATTEGSMGGLANIASSFGVDVGVGSADAIYPELYPELMESNNFVVDLLKVKVKTVDGLLTTDFYTYLPKPQKQHSLTAPIKSTIGKLKKALSSKKPSGPSKGQEINPFRLSEYDFDLLNKIKKNITCAIDKKTSVISITVQDQDPMVSAIMADSVKEHLQSFIIDYRTAKARIDVNHYQHLADSAKIEYDQSVARYSAYCDANQDVLLQVAISERDKLESEMQLKYNTYTAMCTQLEMTKAKLQERTPVFTTLVSASVPVKPAGPKRMLFVVGMLFLATMVAAFWLTRDVLIGRGDDEKTATTPQQKTENE